eukprot:c5866_g1_i2.p1 GENE.c5866_g1_i2~~c5866_g1_i2.p1  ORF type:complete len:151 (+),score=24.22 c5866_g1_i2:176-628(+)
MVFCRPSKKADSEAPNKTSSATSITFPNRSEEAKTTEWVKAKATIDVSKLEKGDKAYLERITKQNQVFTLSKPSVQGSPTVYASPAYYDFTGFSEKEIVGLDSQTITDLLLGSHCSNEELDRIASSMSLDLISSACLVSHFPVYPALLIV